MHHDTTCALTQHRIERARIDGATAYKEGKPCLPPARYCDFSYNWVEGWTSAALDAARNKQYLAAA